jgi:flagellar hook-basal body complex protein FliE
VNVQPLIPDLGPAAPPSPAGGAGAAFGNLLDAAGAALGAADIAERRFAQRHGTLTEMVVERTRAGIALQVATATAQRVVQSLQTLFSTQV